MSFRLTVSAVTEPFDPQPELSTESTAPTEETTEAPTEETAIEETTTEPTTAEETTADIVTEPETTEAEKPIGAITPIPVGEDDNESYIWHSNDEVEHDENNSKLTSQGIHYDPSTDKLYRPLSSSNSVKENDVYVYKLNYNSVTDTSNPTQKEHWNIDRVSGNNSFEIEGIGFITIKWLETILRKSAIQYSNTMTASAFTLRIVLKAQ